MHFLKCWINKSSGSDGVCVEFLKIYWTDIKYDLFFQIVMFGLHEEKMAYT